MNKHTQALEKRVKTLEGQLSALASFLDAEVKAARGFDLLFFSGPHKINPWGVSRREPSAYREDPGRLLSAAEVKQMVQPILDRMGLEVVYTLKSNAPSHYEVQKKSKKKPAPKLPRADEDDE